MSSLTTALARVLNQFTEADNYQALLTAVFNRLEDTNSMLNSMLTEKDIDSAGGVWLDELGVKVGVERTYVEIDAAFIFAFKEDPGDADDPDKAYYDPAGPTGGFYQSAEGLRSPSGDLIGDNAYYRILKAKGAANHVIGNIDEIADFIFQGFNVESIVTDDIAGEIAVELISALSQGERRAVEQLAPVAGSFSLAITNWP